MRWERLNLDIAQVKDGILILKGDCIKQMFQSVNQIDGQINSWSGDDGKDRVLSIAVDIWERGGRQSKPGHEPKHELSNP